MKIGQRGFVSGKKLQNSRKGGAISSRRTSIAITQAILPISDSDLAILVDEDSILICRVSFDSVIVVYKTPVIFPIASVANSSNLFFDRSFERLKQLSARFFRSPFDIIDFE